MIVTRYNAVLGGADERLSRWRQELFSRNHVFVPLIAWAAVKKGPRPARILLVKRRHDNPCFCATIGSIVEIPDFRKFPIHRNRRDDNRENI